MRMKRINKKLKIIVIILLCSIASLALILTFFLNYHSIYVFSQRQGWFKASVEISEEQVSEVRELSFSELYKMEDVSFDQSLMLINKEHMLPEGFVPDVLEYKKTTVYMSRCMLDAYASLSEAVKERTGNKLYVSSDLRSREEQEALYLEDPLTATLPGASEHESGLALDVYVAYYAGDGFIKSPSGRFVNSNAHKYGFIIRYPSYGEEITGIRYEPWHIRYVGAPHANVIYNNHITLEEYIESFDLGKWYSIDGYLISRQAVDESSTLILPESFESCIISPDNTGCCIVTVK